MDAFVRQWSRRINYLPVEQGGLVTPARRVSVSAQDLDQHIVLESIPGPLDSDMISIETLVDDS